MRLIFSILIFTLFIEITVSQPDNLIFKNLSSLDGLSQNWVRCIYQDDLGYMWFGTANGLNRYDGYEFKVFRPDLKNPYSLGDLYINDISKKSDNELWICTQKGVYIYNQKNEKFSCFKPLKQNDVISVLEDYEKILWFASTNGLYKYNPTDNSVVEYMPDPNKKGSISNYNIRIIYEDQEKNLWIGSYSGLDRYDRKSGCFENFMPTKSLKDLHSNMIFCIKEDNIGRLWLGVGQGGLVLFEYSKRNSKDSKFSYICKGSPASLVFDNDSNLWIGNGGGLGLSILKAKNFKVTDRAIYKSYFQSEFLDNGISSNSLSSIFMDCMGDIWIGTYGGGINCYSKRAKKFRNFGMAKERKSISSNLINAIFEDEKYLWIGTENALDRKDLKTGEIVSFKHENDNPYSIGANAIYSIYKDSRNILWIGSWNGGLSQHDFQSNTFRNYLPDQGAKSISNPNVFSICEDSIGNLWLSTISGGLNKFDYQTKTFESYLHNRSDSNSINGNIVHQVYITKQGKIWVSLFGSSLDLFNEKEGIFRHFVHNPNDSNSISSGSILSVFEDSKNNLWVASNMGLNLYNPINNTFRHFTVDDGLPNNSIQAILEDDKGNLWLSTLNGLSVFYNAINKPVVPRFRNYDKDDGLPINEFTIRAAFKNKKGYFYFGTSHGYTYFHPDSINDNLIPPVTVITSFELLQTSNVLNENNLLIDETIYKDEKLRLSYQQSDFTIRYAALNYLNSEKNQYKYRLDGYEDDWHYTGKQRFATYTNIQPGEYTFIVYGSNNDGVWSLTPMELKIIISPPWWKTLLFRIFIVTLVFAFLIAIYRIRLKILEDQKRILINTVDERTRELLDTNSLLEEKSEEIAIQNEELSKHRNNLEQLIEERTFELAAAKSKAEESDRLKSSFLANMSHEIRTPMNAILGFASLLEQDNLNSEDKKKYVKVINVNSETLMVLINDILDISLIESNQLVYNPVIFDATKVMIELEEFYNLKNSKNLVVGFINSKTEPLIMNIDQVRFYQILNNLINNAYKYTETGTIKFGYEKMSDKIQFYVSDTGLGIEKEYFDSIFNQFSKIENKNRQFQRGTGIGLAICKSLIIKMGGKIWVESEIGKGSTFYFTLPFQNLSIDTKQHKIIQSNNTNLGKIRIVIAEDEPTNFELLATYIRDLGLEIYWAKNGFECIEYIKSLPGIEDLVVLMDIKMPIMSGSEAIIEIKKISDKIPVIAITAYAQLSDKYRFLDEGFDEYLSKPIRKDSLMSVLSRFANK